LFVIFIPFVPLKIICCPFILQEDPVTYWYLSMEDRYTCQ